MVALPATAERDIAPLLIESLRAGRAVRFAAWGRSMEPFLRAGDTVTVEPLDPSQVPDGLRAGDVLLYEVRPGVLRLHRLSRVRRSADSATTLRVRGDAPGSPAECVPASAVLGVLTRFERQGCDHDARHPVRRWVGLWWPRLRSRIGGVRAPALPTAESVEFATLVRAVRSALRQSPDSAAAAPTVDPLALVVMARRHGVLALCAQSLSAAVPAAAAELRAAARALAFETERDLDAIAAVLGRLAAEGLRPPVVKGAALGHLAYGNPSLRPFDDLDLLVPGKERSAALAVLERDGWRDSRGSPPVAQRHLLRTTEDLALRDPRHHVAVELVHPCGVLRAAAPREPTVPFQVHGEEARAPSAVEHFLYCVAHGGKHGWTRLVWVVDVDRLAAGFAAEDWDRVVALARQRRLTRQLALGCALAEAVLGTPVPVAALGRWRGGRWLQNATAQCRAWQAAGVRHAGDWRWWLTLQDDAARRWGAAARWLFRPTGADLRACLLPVWAHPLYAVLRPLRLLLRSVLRRGTPALEWDAAPGAR